MQCGYRSPTRPYKGHAEVERLVEGKRQFLDFVVSVQPKHAVKKILESVLAVEKFLESRIETRLVRAKHSIWGQKKAPRREPELSQACELQLADCFFRKPGVRSDFLHRLVFIAHFPRDFFRLIHCSFIAFHGFVKVAHVYCHKIPRTEIT